MSRDALGIPRAQSDDAKAARRRDTPLTIDPRLLLLDADRSLLIGRPEMAAGALTKPIAPHGETVGYLGYVPRPELIASIERVYLRRQHLAFTAIAAGMPTAPANA